MTRDVRDRDRDQSSFNRTGTGTKNKKLPGRNRDRDQKKLVPHISTPDSREHFIFINNRETIKVFLQWKKSSTILHQFKYFISGDKSIGSKLE